LINTFAAHKLITDAFFSAVHGLDQKFFLECKTYVQVFSFPFVWMEI